MRSQAELKNPPDTKSRKLPSAPATNSLNRSFNGPAEEYRRRRREREQTALHFKKLDGIVANGRVVIFLVAAALGFFAWRLQWPTTVWSGLALAGFLALIIGHERIRQRRSRAKRAVEYYDLALARVEDRWVGSGEAGERFIDESHPNAVDLDLFGRGSLFELLCTARTRRGEDTLAAWLLAPAPPDIIRGRQAAVEELRQRLDLREDIALLASEIPAAVDYGAVTSWGAEHLIRFSAATRIFAFLLAAMSISALAGWVVLSLRFLVVLGLLVLEAGFALWFGKRVRRILGPVERRAHDLSLLLGLLARFEREPFTTPRLSQLQADLRSAGLRPSRQIGQLIRLIDWLTAQNNLLFAPLAPFLLWNTQFAFAIEGWRIRSGPAIARWVAAIGELEALCALAAYAYENPADPFPEIDPGHPCFASESLGHPLIPRDRCVVNDVTLGQEAQLWIVSGSNMSGKSTLLRTIGINVVLALAGAPVRAKRLRVSPLVVGATLRIQDSLQAGRSRFFAEITRLHRLLDLALASPPLLFLLDELLQGTNSHDRQIGADAVVRTLLARGAIGLITTHDLALTEIAGRLGTGASNVHFEDQLLDGEMRFDYRIHPGVVQHSNALALMRAVGIDI